MWQTIIKPYHLFNYQYGWYLINIEEMSASQIDEATARVLAKETAMPDGTLDPYTEELLIRLDLLSKGSDQTSSSPNPAKPQAIPVVNMSLFLTQSCNLRCVYCYGDEGKYGSYGNMEKKTAFQAVDWMIEQSGEIKKLHISFFGGEPFLNFPLMKAVVQYAEKRVSNEGKDVAFHATSNATVLDDEKIAFIRDHRIDVMISFDGPKEIQDAQRPYVNGQGSYDSTLPKIKKLLAAVPGTPGHAVIVGNTDRELVKMTMQEIGFAKLSIMPSSPSLFSEDPNKSKPVRDIEHILHELEQEAKKWIHSSKIRDNEALQNLKTGSGLYRALIALLHNRKRRHACGAGRGLVAVDCSGDVYLCHRFVGRKQYKLGSVFGKELHREEYQKSPLSGSGICTTCFARYYCAGGCKHENAGSCGSISIPPTDTCRLKRRELELAASIICNLDAKDRVFLIEQEIFPPKPCPFDF